jgi:dephospho-CoA kinase
MTIEWVRKMRSELAKSNVVLDGSTRPSFIAEACKIHDVKTYKVILIHCSDDVRRDRLLQRGQPELANAQMMEWARYLIRETTKAGGEIINNPSWRGALRDEAIQLLVQRQSWIASLTLAMTTEQASVIKGRKNA